MELSWPQQPISTFLQEKPLSTQLLALGGQEAPPING